MRRNLGSILLGQLRKNTCFGKCQTEDKKESRSLAKLLFVFSLRGSKEPLYYLYMMFMLPSSLYVTASPQNDNFFVSAK